MFPIFIEPKHKGLINVNHISRVENSDNRNYKAKITLSEIKGKMDAHFGNPFTIESNVIEYTHETPEELHNMIITQMDRVFENLLDTYNSHISRNGES